MAPLTEAEVRAVRDAMLMIVEAVRGALGRGKSPLDAVDMILWRATSPDLELRDLRAMIAVLIVMLAEKEELDHAAVDV